MARHVRMPAGPFVDIGETPFAGKHGPPALHRADDPPRDEPVARHLPQPGAVARWCVMCGAAAWMTTPHGDLRPARGPVFVRRREAML